MGNPATTSGCILNRSSPRFIYQDCSACCARSVFVALALCPVLAQQTPEKLAPYYPTPRTIVEEMLTLGALKAGEKMFDLGSGDGRIVIMAAQKFDADSTGIEIDTDLCRQGTAQVRKTHLRS